MQATLNLRPLAAASLCASSEETRFYLCGVLVEIEPRAVTYVATDGHRLFAHREDLAAGDEDNTLLGHFIVPTKSCRAIKLGKKTTSAASLTRSDDGGMFLAHLGERHYFKPVDGEFPDWRRVMPRKGGEAYAHFDGKLVASFSAIAAALGDDQVPRICSPRICPMDANSPALVVFHGREATTFGVIMPMRGEKVSRIVPAWALPIEAEAEAKAA
jgi:DNA polymerase-3 subunit beta